MDEATPLVGCGGPNQLDTNGPFDHSSRRYQLDNRKPQPPPPLIGQFVSEEAISPTRSQSPIAIRKALRIRDRSQLTNWQAAANLLKTNVGTGVLAMPAAVRDAGLLLGCVATFTIGLLMCYAANLLVRSAQYLRRYYNLDDSQDLEFIETARRTAQFGFPASPRIAHLFAGYIKFVLIFINLGALSAYNLFLAENTHYLVSYFEVPSNPSVLVYTVIVFVAVLPVVFIRTLKGLAVLSAIGNGMAVLALLLMLLYSALHLQPVDSVPLVKSMDTIPLFFGVVVFAFESICIILPIENKMADKAAMPGICGILTLTNIIALSFDLALGFYGYLCFGDAVNGAITYSLPMSPWYFGIAKPCYFLPIYVNYAILFHIPHAILWEEHLKPRLISTGRGLFWGDFFLRLGLTTICFLVAVVIPHVDLLISLIGSLAGSSVVLITPALFHSIIVWKEPGPRSKRRRALIIGPNIVLMLCGVLGAIVGTYTSILAVVKVFRNPAV